MQIAHLPVIVCVSVLYVIFAFTFDLPWARQGTSSLHPAHTPRSPCETERQKWLDALFSVQTEVHEYESEDFQFKWDENRRMRKIKKDTEREMAVVSWQ